MLCPCDCVTHHNPGERALTKYHVGYLNCSDSGKFKEAVDKLEGQRRSMAQAFEEAGYDAGASFTVSVSVCGEAGLGIVAKTCVGGSFNPVKLARDAYERKKKDYKAEEEWNAIKNKTVNSSG